MGSSNKVERGRTLSRTQALQLLFQAEARDLSIDRLLETDYLVSKGPATEYAVELARGCYAARPRIDALLRSLSKNWSLDRMPGTDRNLLRLAVYEMRLLPEDEQIEDAIVIDEAVELAKAFGTDESARFVNGVLGQIARAKDLPELYRDPEAGEDAADGDQDMTADTAASDMASPDALEAEE